MWALLLCWGWEVGGLSSLSCLWQGGLVCLILGFTEQVHLAFRESYVLFSKLAFICTKGDMLASICYSFVLFPNVFKLGWRRGKLFLGLVKEPLPFIQTVCTNHLLCACPTLGTEHKAVKPFSIMPGLKTGLIFLKMMIRASLVAQWLRICLPMQGIRVRALVWEDPICRGATGPVSRNCWACASGACAPQQERPR